MKVLRALLFSLLSGITARCDDACAQPTNSLYLPAAITYYNNCSFCAKNFSWSCVQSACPMLKGLCPLDATGNANASALAGLTSALNDCLRTAKVICGISIGHVPMCPMEALVAGMVPTLTGSCGLQEGTGFVDRLNEAYLELSGSGPFQLALSMPNVTSYSSFACSFSSSLLGPSPFASPVLPLHLALSLSASVTIGPSAPPAITVLSSRVLFSADQLKGLPLVPQLIEAINLLFQTAGTDVASANFVVSYVASGLQAALQGCPGSG